ncbi:MAG: hypothetical protein AAGI14_06075 [Pseudomonadota bacterium]
MSGAQVVTSAVQSMEACPDRPHVQALAGALLFTVMQAQSDPEIFGQYLTQINRALNQAEMALQNAPPKITVKKINGTTDDFIGYGLAVQVHEKAVLPGLLHLWQNGYAHFGLRRGLGKVPLHRK